MNALLAVVDVFLIFLIIDIAIRCEDLKQEKARNFLRKKLYHAMRENLASKRGLA